MKPKIKPDQVILFDIDKTLFDGDLFQGLLRSKITHDLAINPQKYDTAFASYRLSLPKRTAAHSKSLIRHLAQILTANPLEIRKLHYDKEIYQQSLFPDVKKTLDKLNSNFVLGLFTEGYKDHQLRKIKKGGISSYFQKDHQYVLFNKRAPRVINSLPQNAVIIDDNPEVVEILLKRPDLAVIWLNRINNHKHPKAYTIHSLNELLNLTIDDKG